MTSYPSIVSRGTLDRDIHSFSDLISAPGPYMEFGEFMYLEASSTDASATLRFSGKFLSTDGEIRAFTEDMVITGTGTQTAVTSRIGPCWLMGFSVRVVAGTITDGEVVCSVHIARASASTPVHVMTLASGEVTNTRALGIGAYTGVDAALVSYAISDPAAGAEISYTVPAGVSGQLMRLFYTQVFDANVAVRTPVIYILRGTGYYAAATAGGGWTAGLTVQFEASFGAPTTSVSLPTSNFYEGRGLSNFILLPGDVIKTRTTNIQVGDQISNASFVIRAIR